MPGGRLNDTASGSKAATPAGDWPALLRVPAPAAVLAMVAYLVLAWLVFLVVDIFAVVGWADGLEQPLWLYLFNDGPVEWVQWPVLALTAGTAGYLGGRLHQGRGGPSLQGAGSFFLVLAVAVGLMLVEEAGDIRHAIGDHVEEVFGAEILGFNNRFVVDLPYMALLAALPLYAVVRHGRHVWRVPSVRPYLAGSVGLFAVAAIGSTLRDVGRFYFRLGAWVDEHVFAGRFPDITGAPRDWAHFHIADGLIEETVESLATVLLLASVLAFAAAVRTDRAGVGEGEPASS